MLDLRFIRENKEKVKASNEKRGLKLNVDELISLDEQRRKKIQEVQDLKAEQNKLGKENIQEAQGIKQQIKNLEPELQSIQEKVGELLLQIPNVLADDVPPGKDESQNVVLRTWGEPQRFSFEPKDHVALGEDLDIIDIERAAKVTGARFAYLKREAALLEFALVQYVLETLTSEKTLQKIAGRTYSSKPFIPVVPPVMVRPEVFRKMARLTEEDKNERYHLSQDDLYLIGSAEHTLGPMHIDESIEEKGLPLRYIGFSTSFRREAGSYGKDTRGILRVHQFDKLEMESFVHPNDSLKEQEFFVAIQEYLLQNLNIPYRVMLMCSGETGMPDARQVDVESWLPGQGKYRETHTADLMTDYQARRLNTRFKKKDGKHEYVHTVDATAFAIGRTLVAIMENYQQKDGSIKIPKVLQKHLGKSEIRHP